MDIKVAIRRLFEELSKQQPLKRTEILRSLPASDATITKKQVKKALRGLVKEGVLEKVKGEKKSYALSSGKSTSNHKQDESDRDSSGENSEKEPMPIAELLRRRNHNPTKKNDDNNKHTKKEEEEASDIDEEIKRLEAELDNDSDGSSSNEEDSADEEEQERENNGVISMSTLAEHRISALPQEYLPTSKTRRLKVDMEDNDTSTKERTKKRHKTDKGTTTTNTISEGLKAAVKSVLDGYVPRSNEKLPFYCRVCAKQYTNDQEFFQHKKTDFHKAAVELEKKASYCKLCRKQLTSPVQLKEHLTSKPHKDRLQFVRQKQQQQPGRR